MIIASTNVLSEPLHPVQEPRYGIERLPAGRRRQAMADAVAILLRS